MVPLPMIAAVGAQKMRLFSTKFDVLSVLSVIYLRHIPFSYEIGLPSKQANAFEIKREHLKN